MFKFLLAFLSVFALLYLWARVAEPPFVVLDGEDHWWLAALIIGVPSVCAWVVAEIIEKTRPRRAFDPRVKRPFMLLAAGIAAGLVSVLAAVPMIIFDQYIPNAAALAAAGVVGSTGVLLVLARKKRGACVSCGYELSVNQPRCPECGLLYTAVK